MRRPLVSSILFGCCLAMTTTATALAEEVHAYPDCTKQPTDAEVQGAKGAFQAGNVSFNESDFERAILYWEDAFRRDCTVPLLLHYLGRAYERHGDLAQAATALRTYLERAPDAPDRAEIQERIEEFERRLEQDRLLAEEAEKLRVMQQKQAVVQKPAETTAPSRSLYVNPIIPLAVAGVGILGTVVGSVIYFPARSDLSDAEDACPERRNCDPSITQDGNDARRRVNLGTAVTFTGLALVGGGVGWYFFNETQAPKARSAKTAELLPVIGPSAVGLLWQRDF